MASDFENKLIKASSEDIVKTGKQLLKKNKLICAFRDSRGRVNALFDDKDHYERVKVTTDGTNQGECSCGECSDKQICCHAIAAILYSGNLNVAPCKPVEEEQAKFAGLKYQTLNNLTAKGAMPNQAFIYLKSETAFPHVPSKWENAIFTVKLQYNGKEYTGNLNNLRELHFQKSLLASLKLEYFSMQERQIIRFMAINGEAENSKVTLNSEKTAELMHCMIGFGNFIRDGRKVIIHGEPAEPIFLWDKSGQETIASSALMIEGSILPLVNPKVITGRSGCWVGVNGEYWWIPATVDVAWLRAVLRTKPQKMDFATARKWLEDKENLPIRTIRHGNQDVPIKKCTVCYSGFLLENDTLALEVKFNYDGINFPVDHGRMVNSANGFWQRDNQLEHHVCAELESFGFVKQGTEDQHIYYLSTPEVIGTFLDAVINSWILENRSFTLNSNLAKLCCGGTGLPEIKFIAEFRKQHAGSYVLEYFMSSGKSRDYWRNIAEAVKRNQCYVKLPGNQIARISPELRRFIAAMSNIIKMVDRDNYLISIPRSAVPYWNALGATLPGSVPPEFARTESLFSPPAEKPGDAAGVPQTGRFQGELRPYQRTGAEWMEQMTSNGFNVILADEMGLGKTIQTLALLAARPLNVRPSLIVCPASLVENWQRESSKFVPEFKAAVLSGTQRSKLWEKAEEYDLLIASYSIAKRDIEIIKDIEFDYLILDEAQHIKNPSTVNAKSCKSISSSGRIVLTGTPLENSPDDLWSIFDFLNPGLLGSFNSFHKYYSNIGSDHYLRNDLSARVAPFIMRRTKDTVCKELPPKQEQTIFCEMTSAQRKLYEKIFKDGQRQLKDYARNGKNNFEILTTLLRLRQICCNPSLLPESTGDNIESAKTSLLQELVLENIDSGHKMLIFSQFTSLLHIIRDWLDTSGIGYEYLDGTTKKRQDRVDNFNKSDNIPVFLLSLKAGGTGLNLTSADKVIIYDPWWNPAVEAQATDRTHRIGQTRPVDSIKLVVEDSIEEKILKLQSKKQEIFDSLIENPAAASHKLSIEDLKFLFQ